MEAGAGTCCRPGGLTGVVETGSDTHTSRRLFCKAVSGGGAGKLLRQTRGAPAVHVLVEGELVLAHPLRFVCDGRALSGAHLRSISGPRPGIVTRALF